MAKILLPIAIGIVAINVLFTAVNIATYKPYLICFFAIVLLAGGAYLGKLLKKLSKIDIINLV